MRFLPILIALGVMSAPLTNAGVLAAPVSINVDAAADRHPISPLIYGVAFATSGQLKALNAPLNRSGGNNQSRYNWKLNCDNRAVDWFFMSIPDDSSTPGARGDEFIAQSKAANAQAMLTIPLLDWVAKVGPNREKLASFSVKKYGKQQQTEEYMTDAGNGLKPDGSKITGNDPRDANVQNSAEFQKGWAQHLVKKWGAAKNGGLKYYLMDNEPAIWHESHRDVQPVGVAMRQLVDKTIEYSRALKSIDPDAIVVGPEEWGWSGFLYSGYDSQRAESLGWDDSKYTDRKNIGGMDALPWYLQQLYKHQTQSGEKVLDVFSVHYYPQGGEFSDEGPNDVSPKIQALRNRSTRSLWDKNYKDESWINDNVYLIPRLKGWVNQYYPGLPVGLTEYNWGAEKHINGATAQADVLGILGREGCDMATRWTTPDASTLAFKAMQMYRNYDGKNGAFGETSVRASTPDPDKVSAFASLRKSDGTLMVMVINKKPSGKNASTPVAINIKNFNAQGTAQVWQLTAANKITHLNDAAVRGSTLSAALPDGSVTLFIVPMAE
jgi:hypothetical protein